MTARLWEYVRVVAHGSSSDHEGSRAKMAQQASADWEIMLNERGREGWELISEHMKGEDWTSGAWIEFSGTMKRPIDPERKSPS